LTNHNQYDMVAAPAYQRRATYTPFIQITSLGSSVR
jgi:hypothetical protein